VPSLRSLDIGTARPTDDGTPGSPELAALDGSAGGS
jgi:hypothetical protein